jgi:hypothetical protein
MPVDGPHPQPAPDAGQLREASREEDAGVALDPSRGYHFHTGRLLAQRLGNAPEWLNRWPEVAIESFARTGNPFTLDRLVEPRRRSGAGGGGAPAPARAVCRDRSAGECGHGPGRGEVFCPLEDTGLSLVR